MHYEEFPSLCEKPHAAETALIQLEATTDPANLDVRIGGGGNFSAAPLVTHVAAGAPQTIATVDPQMKDGIGYAFTGWSSGESSPSTTIVPTKDMTVTGHFHVAAFMVGATTSGPGGSISLNPATGAAGYEPGWYAPGTQLTVTATPLDGYVLGAIHIVADGKETTVSSHDAPLTVNGPIRVEATFAPAQQPAISISTIWAPGAADAAGVSQSKVFFSNGTSAPGFGLRVTAIAFKTTDGKGDVTLIDTLPMDFGALPANSQSVTMPVSYRVPADVRTFDMIVSVEFQDASGALVTKQLTASLARR